MDLTVLSHTYVEPGNRGKLRELARSGPVTVVIPRRWHEQALRRGWLGTAGWDGGVRVVLAPWRGPPHPSLGAMLLPRELCRSRTLLQVEEEPWTPSAYFAAKRWRGPVVVFTWENLPRRFPPPWSWMLRSVLRRVHGVIAGSQSAATAVTTHGYTGLLDVIPQLGVDPPHLDWGSRAAADPMRIVFVGRLVSGKGVDLLLEAAHRMQAPWTLTVVGDGPERPRLETLARQLGIGDRVTFAGPRPHGDVASVWRLADVCVLPARTTRRWAEQFGHVLIEAMSYGVPVVGSTCGAIPEVIGDAGMVFPEGNSAALCATLTTFAEHTDHRQELGARGRRRVERDFTNERIAARTRVFHEQVLAHRRP